MNNINYSKKSLSTTYDLVNDSSIRNGVEFEAIDYPLHKFQVSIYIGGQREGLIPSEVGALSRLESS